MELRPIHLEAAATPADADRDVLGAYQIGALVGVAAGVFGFWMSKQEPGLSHLQRRVGATANAATVVFGAAGVLEPRWFSRLLRSGLPTPVLPCAALATIAASAPDRSPMFFAGTILTAMGAGRTTRARGAVVGGLTGLGYISLVLAQRRPWSAPDRQLWWNVAVMPAFTLAGPIGATLGDTALAIRALERARERDRRTSGPTGSARDTMAEIARRAEQVASQLDSLLLHAARFEGLDPESARQLRAAVETAREDAHHLLLGPVLIAAARGEPLDLLTAVRSIIVSYERVWNAHSAALELEHHLPAGRTVDARTTQAVLRSLKIALDNCERHHQRPLRCVTIALSEQAGWLKLDVEDDGGGIPVPPSQWGTGLSEAQAQCRALGGRVRLTAGENGVRLTARVPLHAAASSVLSDAGGAVGARIDAAVDEVQGLLRLVNTLGAAGCLMTADDGRRGAAAVAAFLGTALIDEVSLRRDRRPDWLADNSLVLIGLLWPAGGRPATGWIGAEQFFCGLRRGWRDTLKTSGATTAALAWSAARVRRSVSAGRIAENVAFPLLCSASGLGVRWLRKRLADAEADAVSLRERGELIERMAYSVRLRHDIIKPIRKSDAWRQGLMETPLGRELNDIGASVEELLETLKRSVIPADPLAELQRHLHTRLSPTPVTVDGERPRLNALLRYRKHADKPRDDQDELSTADPMLQRARYSLALIALADECAARILTRYPPSLLGEWSLLQVHLAVSPQDADKPDTLEVAVRPSPPRTDRRAASLNIVNVLTELDGSLTEGFEDGGFRFTVSSLSLAEP